MGKRLYVGNLPYQVDEDQLRALFEQDGRQVDEVKIVTDRETGRPRGFAFIEMATDAQAQAAVNALHGKPFGGRPVRSAALAFGLLLGCAARRPEPTLAVPAPEPGRVRAVAVADAPIGRGA